MEKQQQQQPLYLILTLDVILVFLPILFLSSPKTKTKIYPGLEGTLLDIKTFFQFSLFSFFGMAHYIP